MIFKTEISAFMKVKNILIGTSLLVMIGCSSTNNMNLQKLPSSESIGYILVEIDSDEILEKSNDVIYDVDENGNVSVVQDDTKNTNHIDQNKYKELFRITNPKEISVLVKKLKEETTGKANVTFSGTLPSAIFFNKKNEPIFSVSIICDDSSIFINNQIIAIDEVKNIITFDADKQEIANGINRPYVKAFFNILKERAPEEVKKLEKRYKHQGGVKKLLCIE